MIILDQNEFPRDIQQAKLLILFLISNKYEPLKEQSKIFSKMPNVCSKKKKNYKKMKYKINKKKKIPFNENNFKKNLNNLDIFSKIKHSKRNRKFLKNSGKNIVSLW